MLVLTRRLGEAIVIDGNIHVQIVAIQGEKIRLGISAPPDVRVDRMEVHQRRAQFDTEVPQPKLILTPPQPQALTPTKVSTPVGDLDNSCPMI